MPAPLVVTAPAAAGALAQGAGMLWPWYAGMGATGAGMVYAGLRGMGIDPLAGGQGQNMYERRGLTPPGARRRLRPGQGGQPLGPAFASEEQLFPSGRSRSAGGSGGTGRVNQQAQPVARAAARERLAAATSAPAPASLGTRNVPIISSGGRSRAADLALQQAEQQVRMDKQFATPDYWKGKEGTAMLQLAQQQSAPSDRPLADYYRAQRAAGIGNQAEIVAGLTAGLEGDKAANMAAWAKANPMLAMREYGERFPAGAPTQGPADAGDFDWAADAGQAAREWERARAERAGQKFSDLSDLPTGGSVGFSPPPTKQAVAAADGAMPQGLPTTGPDDQAILAAMEKGQFFPAEGSPSPIAEDLLRRHLERARVSAGGRR